MNVKKIALILLLVFSVASLVTIVIFAKYRIGVFGTWFDRYAKQRVTEIGRVIDGNLGNIQKEVASFSKDGITRSVFIGSALGESPDRFHKDIQKIKSGIQDCDKIQIFEKEGKILYSTDLKEINSIRLRASILERITNALNTNQDSFLYFMNSNQMVAFSYFKNIESSNRFDGLVAIYYQTARLYNGLKGLKKTTVPVSFDKFIFLSSRAIDPKDIKRVVNFALTGKNVPEKKTKSATFGSWATVRGVRVVYDGSKERYFPVQGIVFLVINFLLLGTVIVALAKVLNDEKYQNGNYTLHGVESVIRNGESRTYENEGVGTLVKDIEEDRTFSEGYANRGIEEMIMTNDMDLTTMPLESEESSHENASDAYSYTGNEIAIEEPEADVTSHPSETEPEISFDKSEFEELPGDDNVTIISEEDLETGTETVSLETKEAASRKIEPSESTSFFAESDRILSGAGDLPEDTVYILPEEEPIITIPTDEEVDAAVSTSHISRRETEEPDTGISFEEPTEFSSEMKEISIGEPDIGDISLDSGNIIAEGQETAAVIPLETDNAAMAETIDLSDVQTEMISFDETEAAGNEENGESLEISFQEDAEKSQPADMDSVSLSTDDVNSESFTLDTLLPEQLSQEDTEISVPEFVLENPEMQNDDFGTIEIGGLDQEQHDVNPESMMEIPTDLEVHDIPDDQEKMNIPEITEADISSSELSVEDEPITISLSELPDIDELNQQISMATPLSETGLDNAVSETVDTMPELQENAVEPSKPEKIDFYKVFSEPPVRMNTLSTVEDYTDAVLNLAKTNLHMDKVYVLKKQDEYFRSISMEGLATADITLEENDPVFKSILSKHKSLVITGDLSRTRYLTERLPESDLENMEEMFIVPVVKEETVQGIAMFGRQKGSEPATNIQKYELYNIGFLQD